MNREILFRGFHECDKNMEIIVNDNVKRGEWVYGELVHDHSCKDDSLEYFIRNCMKGNSDVIPETVGEFTGLVDKNGKRIFEGDIVKVYDTLDWDSINNYFIGNVEFSDASFVIETNIAKHYRWQNYECEIIGTMFGEGMIEYGYDYYFEKCQGDGQASCSICNEKGIWNRN